MQGPTGPLLASKFFRAAVPDLSCDIEQMIIAGDRVVVHLHFRGHFRGTFKALKGQGQRVDFGQPISIRLITVASRPIGISKTTSA